MELFYKERSQADQNFIRLVCNDIFSQPLQDKPYNEDFAFVFVDGRPDMNFDTLEHHTMFHSCRLFSQFRYPIFCFVNNIENLYKFISLLDFDLKIIPIDPINSLEEYTNFCVKKLYNLIPDNIKHVITMQSDGFLLKNEWETYILENNWDYISSPWRHTPSIEEFRNNSWQPFFYPVIVGNGGFSCRRLSLCKLYSKYFKDRLLREKFAANNKIPPEDLFYSVLFNHNLQDAKIPTPTQAEIFSIDPLTPKIYNSNNKPFGFHYFKYE